MNTQPIIDATEQVVNTPLADFTIGLCLFIAAFLIVLLFADENGTT